MTSIGSNAFSGCSNIKAVDIENVSNWLSIIGLSDLTAYISSNSTLTLNGEPLNEVIIPEGIKSIPGYAFRGFKNITSLTIPNSVTSIGSSAFYYCSGLTSVNIPNSVTSIGSSAFNGCSGLTSVNIPNSVTSIGSNAFYNCSSLTSVNIPNSVTSIGSWAFYGCSGLTSLTLPFVGTEKDASASSSSTDFGVIFGTSSYTGSTSTSQHTTYYIPTSLKEVTITGGKIFEKAFQNCSNLTAVTLGDDVDYIGDYAFYNCNNILSIDIPVACTSIGDHAFENTSSLHTINIPATTPPTLATVSSLNNLSTIFVDGNAINEYLAEDNWAAHRAQIIANGDITDYSVEVSALADKSILHQTIGENNLQKVVSLKVAGTINSYDLMVMRNKMVNLKHLDLSDATIVSSSYNYYSNNGVNYTSVDNTLTRYALQPNLFSVKLPNSLTQINDYSLEELTHVESIEIPANVISIGQYAANGLSYLKNLTFAENSNLITIGDYAFHKCSSLTELSIPGSVETMYGTSITGCDKLAKFVLEDGEKSMILYSYNNSCPLKEVYVGRNISTTYTNTNYTNYYSPLYNKTSLALVTIGDGVKSVPMGCFKNSSCSTLIVHSSLTSIGTDAFTNNATTDIYITDVDAWSNISGLSSLMSSSTAKNIYINGEKIESLDLTGVKTMQPYAFEHTTITDVYIDDRESLVNIPDYAFAYTKVNKLMMPSCIETIGKYAFYNCSELEDVKLPPSIVTIGNNAFDECSKLLNIYAFTIDPQEIDRYTFSNYQAATVHCSNANYYNYFYDTQWSQFLDIKMDITEPYDYFYVRRDLVLDDNTGLINGTPDADINAGGGFIVKSKDKQNLDEVHIKYDGTANVGGSLIGNVHANKIYLDIEVKADYWYYFSFPFDVDLKTIQKSGGYVFRYYDSASRANGETGNWKDVAAGTEHLTAGNGYIFRTNTAGTLSICIDKSTVEKFDLTVDKLTNVNSYTATSGTTDNDNKSWNFIGNPYLCYYSINDLDYGAPIIVWNGSSYEAYRPGDDDYTFYPFQAFFIQKPENVDGVGFEAEGQTTYIQSQNASASSAKRRAKALKLNQERKLINLTFSDGENADKTRVVFNDKQKLEFEAECDATKFAVTPGVPQIYSLGNDNTKYSINERPVADGKVKLGYSVPAKGTYTIGTTRMDAHVFIEDAETGKLHDLSDGDYSFESEAGANARRFTLILADDEATAIEMLNAATATDGSDSKSYDLNGRRVKGVKNGVVIKGGKKVYVK